MNSLRLVPAEGADPQAVADAAVAVWGAIDAALSPVIGPRGSAALYKRSLHLARAHHPWLAAAYEGAAHPGDYGALRLALSRQTAVVAAQAHEALMTTFQELLASLIGPSLTARLLRSRLGTPFKRQCRAGHLVMTTDKVTIKRLATGVPGLDEVLGGGLPEFSFNLIAGPPGCGKTTLAHQMMFALATPERPALYFTVLGEPPLKMLRYQQQFDFFDTSQVNGCVRFVNLSRRAASGDLKQVLRASSPRSSRTTPALVFVDSFRSVVLAQEAGKPFISLQQFVQQLGMLMTSWQATTFLIGEYFTETDRQPGVHGGRRPDLAAPERAAQLHGAQDGDHEDARPAHPAGPAHLPHRRAGHRRCSPRASAEARCRRHGRAARAHGCRWACRAWTR